METKFTPAPWRELVTRIDDARGYQICHLDLHGKSEAERDANRHLIASAPDLFAALVALDAMYARAWDTTTGELVFSADSVEKFELAHGAATAAIAKALGEQA